MPDFRGEARPGDGREPPAGREARQSRGDVAEGGIGHPSLDIGHDLERRIHRHNGRDQARIGNYFAITGTSRATRRGTCRISLRRARWPGPGSSDMPTIPC